MKTVFLASLALAGLLHAETALAEDAAAYEKCYGVARAGKNDCASKPAKHQCAGLSRKDGDPAEWIYVRKGTCEKLVNGKK